MRKIIYTTMQGTLAVVHPVRNTVGETLTTDKEIEQRAWDALPKEAINPQWVEESQIPTDRTFRDAWKAGSGTVEHDMAKCREIHKERLRQIRAPILSALDVQYMKADEDGDTVKKLKIAAKKKLLRDVTNDPAIALAQSPDELKFVIPAILEG